MVKRRKRENSDDESPVRKKKTLKNKNKKDETKDNDNEGTNVYACDISENRSIRVRSWKEKIYVDIREFYLNDDKKTPGRKGIMLTVDQWKKLCEHAHEIDAAVADNS